MMQMALFVGGVGVFLSLVAGIYIYKVNKGYKPPRE
jgi:hypothetical protein